MTALALLASVGLAACSSSADNGAPAATDSSSIGANSNDQSAGSALATQTDQADTPAAADTAAADTADTANPDNPSTDSATADAAADTGTSAAAGTQAGTTPATPTTPPAPAATTWVKNIGGTYDELFNAVVQTSDGGFAVAGVATANSKDIPNNKGKNDGIVAKFDAQGNLSWVVNVGGSDDDELDAIIQASDGSLIVAGNTASKDGDVSTNKGRVDAVIAKLDPQGQLLWLKTIGGSGFDSFYAVAATSDGGYIASGGSSSADGDITGNMGDMDAIIAKFDAQGDLSWVKNYGRSSTDQYNSVMQAADGSFICTGVSFIPGYAIPNEEGIITKFDSAGNLIWNKTLGGNGYGWLYSVAQAKNGDYVAAGDTYTLDSSGNAATVDAVVLEYDPNGNIVWSRNIGGSKNDGLVSLAQTSDGQYLAAGSSVSSDGDLPGNNGGIDGMIVKIDAQGNLTWVRNLGGSGDDNLTAVIQAQDGGIVAVGNSNSSDGDIPANNGRNDGIIVKLNAQGEH